MAYSNWTITGTGTSTAQLNSTVPTTLKLPSGTFGTYCRKLNGDGSHIWNLNKPEFTSVPVGKTQTVEMYCGFDAIPFPAGNTTNFLFARARESAGQYGYNTGMYIQNNPYGYPSGFFCLTLNDGTTWSCGASMGQWPPTVYGPTYGLMPLRLVVSSIDANTDEIDLFFETDGSGTITPGGGVWVAANKSKVIGSGTGVTHVGGNNSNGKLIVPSTSPCFAPHVAVSNTAIYWHGLFAAYIDGFKTTVSNTI